MEEKYERECKEKTSKKRGIPFFEGSDNKTIIDILIGDEISTVGIGTNKTKKKEGNSEGEDEIGV